MRILALMFLIFISTIFGIDNIQCKEDRDSFLVCVNPHIIDLYSNDDLNITYNQILLESIQLQNKHKKVLDMAQIYIIPITTPQAQGCANRANGVYNICDYRDNVGFINNYYEISNIDELLLRFDKEMVLETLSWEMLGSKDSILILCNTIPCKINIRNQPKNAYLQAILKPKDDNYRFQAIWNINAINIE